jgi:hypothetical protein
MISADGANIRNDHSVNTNHFETHQFISENDSLSNGDPFDGIACGGVVLRNRRALWPEIVRHVILQG